MEWTHNITLWSGIAAWMVAQLCKLLVFMIREHKFDHGFLLRLGGMPSSHTASVCAAAASIGMRCGFDSSIFALAIGLAILIMIDAQSVRRAAGQQAKLLNQMAEEFYKTRHVAPQKMVEFLGHTRLEVLFGMILGIVVAILLHGLLPPAWSASP